MAKSKLVNCKKCGTLFYKTSGRDICGDCFKKEIFLIEEIKNFVSSSPKEALTIDEIVSSVQGTSIDGIEDLIMRGRLYAALPKISIKCRFCGAELENEQKMGFICKQCLNKFSLKVDNFKYKVNSSTSKYEEEARTLNRRLRGGMFGVGASNRYGFIQNYDL